MARVKYRDRVKTIRRAAEAWYKEEYLRFRQGGCSGYGKCGVNDPLSWRLDVLVDGVNSHALFDLRVDYTPEAIERKFKAMEVSREEFLEGNRAD